MTLSPILLSIDPPLGAEENMNRDRALFERAHHFAAGECEIRIYEWDKATISIGLSQKKDTFNADLLAKDEVSLVKRITGGRAVWHHREITYAVAAPLPSLAFGSDLYSSYRKISGILMFFLKKLSIEASLVRKKGIFANRSLLLYVFKGSVSMKSKWEGKNSLVRLKSEAREPSFSTAPSPCSITRMK